MGGNCSECKKSETTCTVQYIVYESAMERNERYFKRLWALSIILVMLLVASNALWLWHSQQFERAEITTTQNVEQDAKSGNNHFIGGNVYGETKNYDNND